MITAIVLAAGLSTRMGTQKMGLPWGNTTVIGRVIGVLYEAGIRHIRVVTGASHKELKRLVKHNGVELVHNMEYANGEMLTSLQVGLKSLPDDTDAVLVVLGDQPQIDVKVVQEIVWRYEVTEHPIIVPSFRMHRGHPWLLGKPFWQEIIELKPPLTLRDFLNAHHAGIEYVRVETPSVIQDLDTLKDYSNYKP